MAKTTQKDQSLGISGTNHSLQERERLGERGGSKGLQDCMWVWGVHVFSVCQSRGGGRTE